MPDITVILIAAAALGTAAVSLRYEYRCQRRESAGSGGVRPVPRREHERILRAHRTELGVLWAALPDERLHAACYDPLPGDKKVA